MRYEIDLTGVADHDGLHALLRQTLPLPEWYGNNLDALYDVLSEGTEPMEIIFRNADRADESMADYLQALRRMGVDLMLARPELTVRWFGSGRSRYLERVEQLRACTDRHYNCAQSVLIPFAAEAGLDDELAYGVALNFGGGMKRASVCGAVTGGLMALGLFGLDDGPAVAEFHRRMREDHGGYLDCADLLRLNKERGGDRKAHCDGMINDSLALVEQILRDAGKIQ